MSDRSGARFWAVVPAAGSGSRMAADVPKQYLVLGEATVIEHTLWALLGAGFIEKVVVALGAADDRWRELPLSGDERVLAVTGGAERSDSVLAGLLALGQWADQDDWVLVHDAARPCVDCDDLERLRDTLRDDTVGGLLAIPVADTVKQLDPEGRVECTLDRNLLWLAQTPQMFRYGLLLDALQRAQESGVRVTDEAAAVELTGRRPRVVQGSPANLKLTRPEDLVVAANWLQEKG